MTSTTSGLDSWVKQAHGYSGCYATKQKVLQSEEVSRAEFNVVTPTYATVAYSVR